MEMCIGFKQIKEDKKMPRKNWERIDQIVPSDWNYYYSRPKIYKPIIVTNWKQFA